MTDMPPLDADVPQRDWRVTPLDDRGAAQVAANARARRHVGARGHRAHRTRDFAPASTRSTTSSAACRRAPPKKRISSTPAGSSPSPRSCARSRAADTSAAIIRSPDANGPGCTCASSRTRRRARMYASLPQDTAALQREIRELARERNAVILAHNYERPEVQDVADVVGDSLGLSREAARTTARCDRLLRRALHGRDRGDPLAGQDRAAPRPRRRLLARRDDQRRSASRVEGRAPGRRRGVVREHDRRGEGRDRLLLHVGQCGGGRELDSRRSRDSLPSRHVPGRARAAPHGPHEHARVDGRVSRARGHHAAARGRAARGASRTPSFSSTPSAAAPRACSRRCPPATSIPRACRSSPPRE